MLSVSLFDFGKIYSSINARLARILVVFIAWVIVAGCQDLSAESGSFVPISAIDDQLGHVGQLQLVDQDQVRPPSQISSVAVARDDLLKIDVFQVDELDRTVRVGADGAISMPLIGTVSAVGLTVPELESTLEQAYGRDYLRAPQISVFIAESVSRQVTMSGELRRPGLYPVTSETTLLRAVAAAGGLSQIADVNRLYLYRDIGGATRVTQISLSQIRTGQIPDPVLYGGDVVIAFPSGVRVAARNLREALGLARSAALVASPL